MFYPLPTSGIYLASYSFHLRCQKRIKNINNNNNNKKKGELINFYLFI